MQAAKGRIERSALYCRATSNACSDGHAEDIGLNSSALVTSNVDPQVAAEKDRASQPSLHSGKIAFCIKLPDAFHQAISSVAKAESSLIFSKTATVRTFLSLSISFRCIFDTADLGVLLVRP